MKKLRLLLQTILLATAAAVAYGVLHDEITIRICPEYFTVWHPPIYPPDNLTILAAIWGVVASWWMGAILGLLIGGAATLGQRPLMPFKDITRWVLWIMGSAAFGAIGAGFVASLLNARASAQIMGNDLVHFDDDVHRRFTIDLFIHNGSYNVSAIATVIACIFIWRRRIRLTSV